MNLSNKQIIKYSIIAGVVLLIYWNRGLLNPVKKPLDADGGDKTGGENKSFDASSIGRALNKVKTGGIKVKPTPERIDK